MLVRLALFDVELFFCKGKGILKIELRKVYGRKQNNWKSPAQKYMLDIQVIDVLLVNEVFFGYFDTRLVGMNCHTKQRNTRNTRD